KRKRYKEYRFESPSSSVELPFPSSAFDIVIASHVLEHVVEDRRFLDEMVRVLRPGGHLILIVPLDATTERLLTEEELINPDFINKNHFHVRNYNLASLRSRCVATKETRIVFQESDAVAWDWKQSFEDSRRRLLSYGLSGRIMN